jgi:hypothetical protein
VEKIKLFLYIWSRRTFVRRAVYWSMLGDTAEFRPILDDVGAEQRL